jgi:hypothetical protein
MLAHWQPPLQEEVFEFIPTAITSASSGGASGAPEIAIETAALPLDAQTIVAFDPVEVAEPQESGTIAELLEPAASKRGKAKRAGDGAGYGFGSGQGDGSGKGFFNAIAGGRTFIYVLDCSGSMTELRDDGKKRLDRVKFELVRSVAALPEDAQFFIIFFNNFAIPMKGAGLQSATLENKRKYLKWAVERQGGGGTDPIDAMRRAIDMGPDVVYLLTDGRMGRNVPDDVTKLNKGRVAIHTICLGDRAGEPGLKEIAERNRGTYLFAP